MELRTIGKKDRPAVLLLAGKDWEAEAVAAALKGLKKDYRLLIPVFEAEEAAGADLSALEDDLMRDCAGTLWGAYGLNDGAEELLALLDRDKVRIRTRVVEGAFTPPEGGEADPGELRCWTGSKDKAGKNTLAALRARGGHVAALTLKRLPKGKSTLSYCPGTAANQMKKAFGEAICVSRSTVLPAGKEQVRRLLSAGPDERESSRLDRAEPLRTERDGDTLIYEGRSAALPVWHHTIRLESTGKGLTRCTDQILFRADEDNKGMKRTVKRYLIYLQLSRSLSLMRAGNAL